MGELSIKEARPNVTCVEFTRHAQVGRAVTGKPGYILSPYLPRWPEVGYRAESMDARQLKSGDMILDNGTGKVFLIP